MSIRNLNCLFAPRSVAVIGASDQPQRIGTRVLANLIEGGFAGPVWPVNPKHDSVLGQPCFARVASLPEAPSLAIICTPPATIPGLVAELGAAGTRAAIVMTAGLEPQKTGARSVRQAMLEAAKPHLLRILGPGSMGLQRPALQLNASFTHVGARPGKLAFVSQSGALGTAVLDWANQRGIGFSHFIMTGESSDIDVGDLLDYLAEDSDSAAILLCLERISCPRKFLSAGRVAARGKPVIVMKVGRDPAPDADLVFDAAIRRAGMLRVYATEDLFDAVETLARARPHRGERMAVLTNGTGLGLIATDALASGDAPLARWSDSTLAELKRVAAPQANPVDLMADAPVERYTGALEALLREPQADALLFLHAPTAMVSSRLIAEAVAPQMRAADKNVMSCWLGGSGVAEARKLFGEMGLPTYDTPEKAVNGFLQIVQYRRNQDLLMEVPASLLPAPPQRWAARAMVSAALAVGHVALERADAHSLLAAYGIRLADSGAGPCEATLAAGQVRVSSDAVFGPVVLFGQGGVAAHLAADRVAGLPPLNMVLARDMVERTRVARLLAAGPGGRALALDAICRVLVQVSEMVAEIPELMALELDPVLLEGEQALVLNATIHLGAARAANALAIRPYPQELEQEVAWQGAPLLLRPIRPEDAPQHVAFFAALAPEDVRLRFFSAMRELPPTQLARLTQIDYDRAMAFIATRTGSDGMPETLGVVRAVADPDNLKAEFAIVIRSDLKGLGLGTVLFQKLVDYFRSRGTGELSGEALSENSGVQNLVRRFGGVVLPHPEADLVTLRLALR